MIRNHTVLWSQILIGLQALREPLRQVTSSRQFQLRGWWFLSIEPARPTHFVTQLRVAHMICTYIMIIYALCFCRLVSHWIRHWKISFGQHGSNVFTKMSAGALEPWGLRPHAVCVRACQCQVEGYCDMTRGIDLNLCLSKIVLTSISRTFGLQMFWRSKPKPLMFALEGYVQAQPAERVGWGLCTMAKQGPFLPDSVGRATVELYHRAVGMMRADYVKPSRRYPSVPWHEKKVKLDDPQCQVGWRFLAYLLAYLLIYLLPFLLACLLTYLLIYLLTYIFGCSWNVPRYFTSAISNQSGFATSTYHSSSATAQYVRTG